MEMDTYQFDVTDNTQKVRIVVIFTYKSIIQQLICCHNFNVIAKQQQQIQVFICRFASVLKV